MIRSHEEYHLPAPRVNRSAAEKPVKKSFYPTWKKAAAAVQRIPVIVSQLTYYEFYKRDPKLHSVPYRFYKNFPGWGVFLGGEKKVTYPTWRKASVALQLIPSLTSQLTYRKLYKADPKLPSVPYRYYKDFPGWRVFLGGKDFHLTWKKAARSARKIEGIINQATYIKLYKADLRLPSSPEKFYMDFPGWEKFLGNKMKTCYSTWQRASSAAQKIAGIVSQSTYRQLYKADSKLSSAPYRYYANFPGWEVFLGKK